MNIEELARQAGAIRNIGSTPNWTIDTSDLERFAALVLEQAAQKCENHPDGLNMIGGAFVICAEAIRAMKPNTEAKGPRSGPA